MAKQLYLKKLMKQDLDKFHRGKLPKEHRLKLKDFIREELLTTDIKRRKEAQQLEYDALVRLADLKEKICRAFRLKMEDMHLQFLDDLITAHMLPERIPDIAKKHWTGAGDGALFPYVFNILNSESDGKKISSRPKKHQDLAVTGSKQKLQ
jgi:hypothetical protein